MLRRAIPFFAMRAESQEQSKATNGGRWMVYGGGDILLAVEGLSHETAEGELDPIRVVVDLDTLKPDKDTIVALRDHDRGRAIGSWQDIAISPASGVVQSLNLAQPSNPNSLIYVQEVRDLLAAKTPLQASIGANPGPDGRWELIPVGQTVAVNGRSFTAEADLPLYVLRSGVLTETSVVTFGADSTTGRIAATRTKEAVMSTPTVQERLTKLLAARPAKHHGKIAKLVAENKEDAAIEAELDNDEEAEMQAKHAQLQKDHDALKAKCEELEAKLKSQDAAHQAEMGKVQAELKKTLGTVEATAGAGAEGGARFKPVEGDEKPKTLTQAMRVMATKDPKLTGFGLRAAALREFPDVERR